MKTPIKEDADFQKEIAATRETLEYQVEYAIQTYTDELWQAVEARKVTQTELARKASVSRQFLTKVFGGTNNFTLETMVKLAYAIGYKLNMHLSPAEMDCEWHHFYKAHTETVPASIPVGHISKGETHTQDCPANYEDLALAA